MIAVIAGGVGAARFLSGLVQVVDPATITAIVNVGDDTEMHGLYVSPDLDTVTYTLAGAINPETGWGLRDETWNAMESLRRYGGPSWFGLGDRDIGTHLYRTGRMARGARLSEVTAEIARAWSLELNIVPATDDRLRTMITVAEEPGERELSFQEYFVQRRHEVPVRSLRFDGADRVSPAPGVLEVLSEAEVIVIAPSNPLVSIGPVLAIPAIAAGIAERSERVVAVSPIVAGAALKGPADRMLRELGHESSAAGVAEIYSRFASALVIDEVDADLAGAVEAHGVRAVVTRTVMSSPAASAALARATLEAVPGR